MSDERLYDIYADAYELGVRSNDDDPHARAKRACFEAGQAEQRETDLAIIGQASLAAYERKLTDFEKFADSIASRIRAASLITETGPDTETTKLDPEPIATGYSETERGVLLRVPYYEPMHPFHRFLPRPEYSQNPADYGITPEPNTEDGR